MYLLLFSVSCLSGLKEIYDEIIWLFHLYLKGLPGGSAGKEYTFAGIHECRRPGFSPWVGKTPWRRERLFTPVLWPGEFHGFFHGVAQSWTHWATFASPHLLESVVVVARPEQFQVFLITQRCAAGVMGRAEETRRDTCARGRGPKPGPFMALHPRTLASVLTPWPTARLAWAEPPPGLPQVGLVLGSFRLFNAVVNGIAR